MRRADVIRAWKDPLYRSSLTAEALSQLPSHPSGAIELREEDLKRISGSAEALTTAIDCTAYTFNNWRRCCPR